MTRFSKYVFLIIPFLLQIGFSQAAVSNGSIGFRLNDFGQLRFFDANGTVQNERFSLLFATGADKVFDYVKDSDVVIEAFSDTLENGNLLRLNNTVDNSFNNSAPDLTLQTTVYTWNNTSAYGIVEYKLNYLGPDSLVLSPLIGFELLPQINDVFGGETVEFDSASGIISVSNDNSDYVGIKILSHPQKSLVTFLWSNGYGDRDQDLFNLLNSDTTFNTLTDTLGIGTVAIPAAVSNSVEIGDTITVYVAVALGEDQPALATQINLAEQRYNGIFVGIENVSNAIPEVFELQQNYPNPFNPKTIIPFSITKSGNVELAVYNILGQKVTTLINENLAVGSYKADFQAEQLASGIYFYKLTSNGQTQTRKMLLIQ